jgi:hypothetical protein
MDMTKRFITTDTRDEDGCLMEGAAYPIDTDEQIEAAREAMRKAGLNQAAVFAGDPNCPDSYATGQVLFAAPLYTADQGRV